MEALMFMMDVVCIVLLVRAVVLADRASAKRAPSLGLFAYKSTQAAKGKIKNGYSADGASRDA